MLNNELWVTLYYEDFKVPYKIIDTIHSSNGHTSFVLMNMEGVFLTADIRHCRLHTKLHEALREDE